MRRKKPSETKVLTMAAPSAKNRLPLSVSDAMAAHQAGNLPHAEAIYRRALDHDPDHPSALHFLGLILYQRGQAAEAVPLVLRSIERDGTNAMFRSNFGLILLALGQVDEAADACRNAVRLDPNLPEAHNNLANALLAKGSLLEALQHYTRAVEIRPGYIEAWTNIGVILARMGKLPEAIAHYQKVMLLSIPHPPLHYNLGNALAAADRHDEAMAEYEKALALDPNHHDALTNFAVSMQGNRSIEETVEWHRHTLALHPGHAKIRFNMGMLHLKSGDFPAGWPAYEARFQANHEVVFRKFSQPQWLGEPLGGRRVWLYPEQGLGDTLQFLRYVPLVQAAGGQVILEVQPQLRRLAEQMTCATGIELLEDGTSPAQYDLQCPLLSLPFAFGTTLGTIPAEIPYLSVPAEETAQAAAFPWPEPSLRVGLVWAGSTDHKRDRFRSIPLLEWEPILRTPGVAFFSLQLGAAAEQAAALQDQGLTILDLALDKSNMAATAAKMAHLDLVISVDTAVAHLAGALGRRTWILLDHLPDWRWMLDRDDSPWYPTARLFRQQTRSDWAPVVAAVARELARLRDQAEPAPTQPQKELTHA